MPDTNDLDNNNVETRPKSTSPTHSNKSQSSSPLHSTLLVIDDSSNSEEEATVINQTNNIPTKHQPTNNSQTPHLHQLPPRQNSINHVIEQQRRRNSSIAKLLGGQPLHNQQYEEINQQIIDDQTAQNMNNNHDGGNDSAIQRTRSSITRTLLMNSDRTNSMTKKMPLPPLPPMKTTSGPSYPKDFEYLIHGEPDHDNGSSINQRTNSISKIYSNLNPSNSLLAHPLNTMRLKRKRQILKTPSNVPPFALHDPFELQTSSSSSPANNSVPSTNHSPNKYVHFESSKRPCHPHHQSSHVSIDNPPSSYKQQNHRTSSSYNQFSIHDDQRPAANRLSPPCHFGHASNPKESTSNTNQVSTDDTVKSTQKSKSTIIQPDGDERPRQRSYSNLSESSSPTTIPLKKRLLDAYNNEQ